MLFRRVAPGAVLLLIGGGVFCQGVLAAPAGDMDGLALSASRHAVTLAATAAGCVLLGGGVPFRPSPFLWAWIVVALVAASGGLDPGRRFTLVWRGVAYLGFLPYLDVLVRASRGALAGKVGLVAGVLTQPLGPPPVPGVPMGR